MFAQALMTFALLVSPVISAPQPMYRGPAVKCSTANDVLSLPAGQTVLVAPSGAPSFIGLGVGTQNYTCSAAGTYVTAGALAELFDITCLYGQRQFATLTQTAYNQWSKSPASETAAAAIAALVGNPYVLGQHFFQPNTAGGISAVWDFRSASMVGHPNAFVVGAKTGDLPSPNGSSNVDWLQLKNAAGLLATAIFRTATVSGQPPASCTVGSAPITVKYTSQYWLYGSTA